MEQDDIISLYETVAGLTDRMLAAARAGDWEELTALENLCATQVEAIRQIQEARQPLSPLAREQKVQFIRKILDDDRQIRSITEPWLDDIAALINSSGSKRKPGRPCNSNRTG
jgi:flagellar protein FliT